MMQFWNPDLHISTDFYLATQTPVVLLLLTGKETRFRRQNTAPPFVYLCLAHAAGTTAPAGRWQEDADTGHRIQ